MELASLSHVQKASASAFNASLQKDFLEVNGEDKVVFRLTFKKKYEKPMKDFNLDRSSIYSNWPLTRIYKAVEICHNTFLERIFNTAYFTREEALFTVRRQLAMAKNVQKIKNASKDSLKKIKKKTRKDEHFAFTPLTKPKVLEPFSLCSYIPK